MYGLRARGMSRAEARREAERVLRLVGLESLTHRTRRELSGGERQRVAVARALIQEPLLLLDDEPTGSLDRTTAISVVKLLLGLQQQEGTMLAVVTHSLELAQMLGRQWVLDQGRLT